jgi:hypothetical protein
VSSCKLRYFNSLEFFDHTASTNLLSDWTQAMTCSHCPTYPALLTVDEDALYTEHKVKRKNQGLRMKSAILCLLALSLLPSMSQTQVPVFQIDHATSTVKFNVSASVPISGTFDKWDATLTFTSPELATGVLDIKIQADSVNTGSGVKDFASCWRY